MTMDRRTFLGTGAFGAALALLHTKWEAVMHAASIDAIGLQLYTVRTEMAKDVEGTLAKVAAIGVKEVEFAGYFDKTPTAVRDMLKRHGLTSPSTHIDYASLGDKFPAIVEASKTIGHQFIVCPFLSEDLRKEPDVWKRIAATFNKAGETSKKAGIQFAYHNHHFEFVPVAGTLPFDILLAECDPSLVKMEMDLCWMAVAGQDPLAYFQKYPGRFPLVHVKGLSKRPPTPEPGAPAVPFDQAIPLITDVGHNDVIDWKPIFAKAGQAGIKHYFLEHDQPAAPFDSVKASYEYLHGLKF